MSSIYEALQRSQQGKPPVAAPATLTEKSSRNVGVLISVALFSIALVVAGIVVFGFSGAKKNTQEHRLMPPAVAVPSSENSFDETASAVFHAGEERSLPGDAETKALIEGHGDVETSLSLGAAFYERGDYENALLTYMEVHRYYRSDIRLLNNIGSVLLALGKAEKAVEFFMQAQKQSSTTVEPVYNIACAYALMKKRDAALESLLAAVAMHPEVAEWARNDPDLSFLSGDPVFEAILERR